MERTPGSRGCGRDPLGRRDRGDGLQPPVPCDRPRAGDHVLLRQRHGRARRLSTCIAHGPLQNGGAGRHVRGRAIHRDHLPVLWGARPPGRLSHLRHDAGARSALRREHRRLGVLRRQRPAGDDGAGGPLPLAPHVQLSPARRLSSAGAWLLGEGRPRYVQERLLARHAGQADGAVHLRGRPAHLSRAGADGRAHLPERPVGERRGGLAGRRTRFPVAQPRAGRARQDDLGPGAESLAQAVPARKRRRFPRPDQSDAARGPGQRGQVGQPRQRRLRHRGPRVPRMGP